MRYVAVCIKGSHIQDIPWFMWAHRGSDHEVTDTVRHCRAYKELSFVRSATQGEGLSALRVSCAACKRSRPLSELVLRDALLRDGIRCAGTQPWEESKQGEPCEHKLAAVQRGATGNYIAERLSALDIPEDRPASLELLDMVRAHVYFEKVVADNGGPQAELVAGWIADELGTTKEVVVDAAAGGEQPGRGAPLLDLKDGEWAAFAHKLDAGRDRTSGDFIVDGHRVEPRAGWPLALTDNLLSIGQVRRVREVRALRRFQRWDTSADFISPDLGADRRRRPVYPAVEMFGEGVFIRFDEARLQAWEQQDAVAARADILRRRGQEFPWAERLDIPEPRFIALHTIAHLLIRRLAFASGYSSASLQERIYAQSDRPDHTGGILIYTAAGDAQGTLGGLVRLGAPDALIPLLAAALVDADVCSNDPVCIESDRQGSQQLNLSACHGCCLISETSCETSNRLLDRQLVLGGRHVTGLLEGVLTELRDAS